MVGKKVQNIHAIMQLYESRAFLLRAKLYQANHLECSSLWTSAILSNSKERQRQITTVCISYELQSFRRHV